MRLLLLALVVLLAPAGRAQDRPTAAPADVASIEALLAATYAVISGPADRERDWDRFRSLFAPGARLIPTQPADAGGRMPVSLTPDEFAERSGTAMRTAPMFQGKGFYEVEAARRVERYGSIAHVWSTYESRLDPSEAPFARGINSFQLVHDGARWWVVSIFWEQEAEATPIPAPYLID